VYEKLVTAEHFLINGFPIV